VIIKLEAGGPVFYIRKRVGLNGKIFDFYKFSSMVGNDNKDNDKDLWRVKDENQITKIGKILRKTHFDELPQSINLLKGDLSFVGPRPEWIEIAKIFEQEIPFYKQRYLVKPGLFGWAQINYKASSSIDEAKKKFEYDLYYIKNQSILLDLEIILKSINLFFQ
jgi:lipopolysaccharide/colanic/teichoic acid biosynthesis glycosyltransferase